MVFGNCGVLAADNLTNKGYVEMTGIDSETSQDIADAITNRMGRYLEAQVCFISTDIGSQKDNFVFSLDSRFQVSV